MDQSLPIPILIKYEEKPLGGPEIIDLDEQVSSEDIILEWCTKVRLKFKSFFIADTERNLDTLMKWYIQFLKAEAMNIDDYSILKVEVFKHIEFFKIIFSELDCPFVDNYLDNMEDIMALYFDLEASTLLKKQSVNHGNNLKIVGRKLIATFNSFLMYREERVHHVLMKIKLTSEENTGLINFLYRKLLTKKSTNQSDLAFCRTYILYQKWKTIQKPESWQEMDKVMYERFDRSPDSLKTNQTLKQILFPQNESVLNVLTHISNNYTMMSEEYFKFMRSQNIHEDGIVPLEVINVDLDEGSPPEEVEDGEHESFHRVYNDYVDSMANITISGDSTPSTNADVQPASSETDDECVIVGVGTINFGQSSSDLVCEISDDDDIKDIIFFQPKQETPVERKKEKRKSREVPVSFLDSIDISNPPSRDIPSPPLSPIIFTAVTPPSSKGSSDSPSESGPKSDFLIPKPPRRTSKTSVPQSRKRVRKHFAPRPLSQKLSMRKIERRKIFLEKRRQQAEEEKLAPEPEVETLPHKKFNHIETQTDFQPAEAEEIFRPCLVTPPSEHHHEDREIDFVESNVYANILPSTSICTQVDASLEQNAAEPEEPAGPEQDPVPPDPAILTLDVVASDSSPTSSNAVSISTSNRADYCCSSPNSADVSSTSHDNDAKTDEGSEGGAPAANVSDKWSCRDFDKFQEELNAATEDRCGRVHSHWDALIANHGLDDNFLSGPLRNGANLCVNPYKNFDLFGNVTPPPPERIAPTPHDSSKTSSSGMPSPPFEEMYDFGNYLTTYNVQNGPPPASDPFKAPSVKPRKKKKSLVFADTAEEAVRRHTPQAIPNSVLQGILKKPRRRRMRISRRRMNMRSLRLYGVDPSDVCLQGDPKIVLERIGAEEIARWKTMSEISRKARLQRRPAFEMLSTSVCRVDYDKSTLTLNENDRIQYNSEFDAMRRWRCDDADEPLEGDLPYTDKKNGKRKRQGSAVPKKRVCRKATEGTLKDPSVRRTSRTIKVPDKDYDSLVKSGYTARIQFE